MRKEHICTICPIGCRLAWEDGEVSGNKCDRGYTFMMDEVTAPKRSISSTVAVRKSTYRRLPVKTSKPIPKELTVEAVKQLMDVAVTPPVIIGDVILANVLETGVDFIATRSI